MSISIRTLSKSDLPLSDLVLDLLNRTQGDGLFKKEYVERALTHPDYFTVAAFQGNSLVGVGVANLINDFEFYEPFLSDISAELKGKIVGSFSTLAIQENLQGQGIGQMISHKRLEWLKAKNCEVILGVSWVSGFAHTSDRVFKRMGFTEVKRLENFFYESSLKNPFVCPACGGPPCQCAAILFRMNLR